MEEFSANLRLREYLRLSSAKLRPANSKPARKTRPANLNTLKVCRKKKNWVAFFICLWRTFRLLDIRDRFFELLYKAELFGTPWIYLYNVYMHTRCEHFTFNARSRHMCRQGCPTRGSNQQSFDYGAHALPTELASRHLFELGWNS